MEKFYIFERLRDYKRIIELFYSNNKNWKQDISYKQGMVTHRYYDQAEVLFFYNTLGELIKMMKKQGSSNYWLSNLSDRGLYEYSFQDLAKSTFRQCRSNVKRSIIGHRQFRERFQKTIACNRSRFMFGQRQFVWIDDKKEAG